MDDLTRPHLGDFVLASKRLACVRCCQKLREADRRLTSPAWDDQSDVCEYVYLRLWSEGGEDKVGHSNKPRRRGAEIDRDTGRKTEPAKTYKTPVADELEKALLEHFQHFRVRGAPGREWFDLPEEEVNGFMDTAARYERHLLAVEAFRLEAFIAWYEATYRQQDEAEGAAERAKKGAANSEKTRRILSGGFPGENEAGADPPAAPPEKPGGRKKGG